MITIEMQGIKNLQDQLAGLPLKLQAKAMKEGTRAAAAIIKQEARANAPIGGDFRNKRKIKKHLKDLIGFGIGTKHFTARSMGVAKFRGDTVTHIVGLKKGGMHGIPIHFGHRVIARKNSALQGPAEYKKDRKGRFRYKGIKLGFVPANDFIGTAMDRNAKRIMSILTIRTQQAINAGLFSKGRAFRQN